MLKKMGLSHLARNKSHFKKKDKIILRNIIFSLQMMKSADIFGGFLHFLCLFSRFKPLYRTPVRRRLAQNDLCI